MNEEKPTFQHPQPQTNQPAQDQIAGIDSQQSQQIVALAQGLGAVQNARINFNTDLIGLFETVSVVPVSVPQSPYDQIKIYINSTTYRLYWYDGAGATWHYVTATA